MKFPAASHLVAIMALLLSQSAQAASPSIWNGGGANDNWDNPANWSGNVPVPGTSYDLQFDGSTRLGPTNNFTAGSDFRNITFNAGASAFTLGGNALTLNGNITNSNSNLQTINLDMVLAAGAHSVATAGSGGDVTLGGNLSGTGDLSKNNTTGQLTLSGSNTFTGVFSTGGFVAGSSVRLANANALQNAVLSMTSSNPVIFASGIGNFTVSGITINNSLNLVDEAAAAVTLTIQGDGNQALGPARLFTGNGSAIFNMDAGGRQTFNTSAVANTVSYTINSGTVSLVQPGLLKSTNDVIINGGTLDLNQAAVATNNQTMGSLSGTGGTITTSGSVTTSVLTVNQATDGTFAGTIEQGTASGDVSLTKQGSATLTLSGANSYDGVTRINAGGALNIQNADALGTTANGTIVSTGAALEIQGGITVAEALTDVRGTGISNDGALRNISGTNTLSGLISMPLAMRINSDAGTLTLSGGVTAGGAALTVGGAGNTSVTSVLALGAGGGSTLTKDGSGTLTLSGANSYGGSTTISEGTVIAGTNSLSSTSGAFGSASSAITLGSASLSGSASIVTNGAFTIGRNITEVASPTNSSFSIGGIQTSGTSTYTGNIILTKATTLTSAAGGQVDFTGIISGVGINTTINGGGAVKLAGVNTYSGLTTISAGTLILASSGSINNSTGVNLGTFGSQGTLDLTSKASYSFGAGQTVSGYGTINIGTGKVVTIANLAPGNSPGQVNVTGNLVLTTTTTTELAGTGGVKGVDFDNTTVSEALTYGGTLSIVSFGGFNINQPGTYSLFDFASQSGNFSSVSVGATSLTFGASVWTGSDSGFDYSFALATGDLTVVPEPSTALLLVGALAAAVAFRRRRSEPHRALK